MAPTGASGGGERRGRLYVVATPIGNLEDITLRAARVLGEVALVAAEDTRVTGRLLAHLGIKVPMLSYRDENERRQAPALVKRLLAGEDVALTSDAGTPCISDPGYRLVRAAADAGVEVVAVAGPSAVTALLSAAGLTTDRFSFEGFVPSRQSARRRLFKELGTQAGTVVFYESPRRLVASLDDLAEVLDDPFVAVGRELTKMHEEILRGKASQIRDHFLAEPPRGEVVVGVEVPALNRDLDGEELIAAVTERAARGESARDTAVALRERGASRRAVYAIYQQLGKPEDEDA